MQKRIMQKSIRYTISYISLAIAGLGVAITAIASTITPVQTYAPDKRATISQMYAQDVRTEGFSEIPVLVSYAAPELKAALALERAYFEREQMSCHIGHDVLWDSQDPDYTQDKSFSMTDAGLVKVSLAQGSDIYYELACTAANNSVECKVADVIFDDKLTLKSYLREACR